jgi:hypothetical protein
MANSVRAGIGRTMANARYRLPRIASFTGGVEIEEGSANGERMLRSPGPGAHLLAQTG